MENKHTKLGIASFALSVLTGACSFGLIVIVALARAMHDGDEHSARAAKIILAVLLFGLFASNLIALGLGIAGLNQPERKKLFALLGTVFASAQIVLTILFVLATTRH